VKIGESPISHPVSIIISCSIEIAQFWIANFVGTNDYPMNLFACGNNKLKSLTDMIAEIHNIAPREDGGRRLV
jgi:hypothetical protein